MTQINSYLTFSGNCREAMEYYKECFGGNLIFQTIGESPLSDKMPEEIKGYILQATLTNDNLVLMGSDMVPSQGLVRGNAVSLSLSCSSEEEIKRFYNTLASGGEATNPLEISFWGAISGDLTDRYGNHWLLHFDKNQQQ